MRQYEPIWQQLKDKKKVQLVAPVSEHTRIKRAVIKEKYADVGFKLLCGESFTTYKMVVKVESTKMTFTLESFNNKYRL